MAKLDYILRLMETQKAETLALRAGHPPRIKPAPDDLKLPPFNKRMIRELVHELFNEEDQATFRRNGLVEMVYEYNGTYYRGRIEKKNGSTEVEFWSLAEGENEGTDPPASGRKRANAGAPDLTAGESNLIDMVGGGPRERTRVSRDRPRGEAQQPWDRARGQTERRERRERRRDRREREQRREDDSIVEASSSTGYSQGSLSQGYSQSGYSQSSSYSQDYSAADESISAGLREDEREDYSEVVETTQAPSVRGQRSPSSMHKLLRWMTSEKASDLHLTPDSPPIIRIDSQLVHGRGDAIPAEDLKEIICSILTPAEQKWLEKHRSLDLLYETPDLGRFRMNIFSQLRGVAMAARWIRPLMGSFEELGLPSELRWLTRLRSGLVLFTGPTGAGKSTTMAVVVEAINQSRDAHILTIEDPIEQIYTPARCLIQQRQIGAHVDDFANGLRDALREDPDIILVGELRDLETISMAISAAETGHLVLATLHTNTTINAITRLVDSYPEDLRLSARAQLSDTLRAVINQRLIRKSEGRGMLPVVEFMKVNLAISNMIRESKLHQIFQVLTTGASEGMCTFEKSLVDMYRKNKITYEQAYMVAPDKRIFEQFLTQKRTTAATRRNS